MSKGTLAVVSISGGKDSTATGLLAQAMMGEDCRFVYADTGNEHEETDAYVREYLPTVFGRPVDVVTASFERQMAGKREYIKEHWEKDGVPVERIERALELLQPTGNPFLDMCLWKGRFPSRMAQFCTHELKRAPLEKYFFDLMAKGYELQSWRGVRADESFKRKDTKFMDRAAEGYWIVHPIHDWTAQETVDYVTGCGVKLNVLYERGMGRVGCMPCINAQKGEIAEIARRFPEHIDRIREWEALVSQTAKQGLATFFTGRKQEDLSDQEYIVKWGIDGHVAWSQTKYGGKELDPEKVEAPAMCSSQYGLCE